MRFCSIPGCGRKHSAKGYCSKHYWHLTQYGEVPEITYRDRNEIIIEGNIARIILSDRNCNITGEAIIDAKYVPYIKDYKWCLRNGYAATNYWDENKNHSIIKLHQAIMGLAGKYDGTENKMFDHANRNRLDCREENLRECNAQQNSQNKEKYITPFTTSKYKGVSWDTKHQKWSVYIQINRKSKWLGYFINEKDAAKAYNKAAQQYFGEFAVLNNI